MARAPRSRPERAPSKGKGGSPPAVSDPKELDPLGPYREKRDFAITPEPRAESSPASTAPGKETTAGQRGIFVIQRHDARRLHYDVRLESEGAMMSFAVPKGPSYDPAVKRLAVEVEDHPMAYNEFEGEIPAGQYGAGDVVLWDRGTYETVPPGQMRFMRDKGHVHVRLFGDKLKGEWHFIKTKGPAPDVDVNSKQPVWLMMKAQDRYADPSLDIVTERPESVRGREDRSASSLLSMMSEVARASTPHFMPSGPNWTYEIKYDGYRVLAAKSRGEVRLCSRNATDFTNTFPPVVEAMLALDADEVVLDGEAVAIDKHGASSFECLQEWITNQVKGWPQTQRLAFAVFDVLWLDGRDLRRKPVEERRAILREVLRDAKAPITISTALEGDGQEVLKKALAAGLEGLIAKKKGSAYVSGVSDVWLKLKGGLRQEFAVIGYVPLDGSTVMGALVLAVMGEDGKFHFIGKVGTGFSDLQRREWSQRLDPDRNPEPAAIDLTKDVIRDKPYWVTPKHVVEVRFDRWLKEGVIRFPTFLGLRVDKTPEQCKREQAPPSRKQNEEEMEPPPTSRGVTVAAVTNPEKVLFPDDGITKKEIIDYYTAVAPVLLPHFAGRPITFQRWPNGIHDKQWFQHHPPENSPPFVRQVMVRAEKKPIVIVDNVQTLRWLGNLAALTIHQWASHVPPGVSSTEAIEEALDRPDYVVFDLDPGDTPWEALIEVAQALHTLLDALSLPSVVKTSGKRGLHVVVPIARGPTHEEVTLFAEQVAAAVAKVLPKIATVERMKDKRGGRLYVDYLQNGWQKTIVAPYTIRAIDGAPVSTPLLWSEVTTRLDPLRFTVRTVLDRIDQHGDLFAAAVRGTARLPTIGR